jgi:hypothetical protein
MFAVSWCADAETGTTAGIGFTSVHYVLTVAADATGVKETAVYWGFSGISRAGY